MVIFNEQENRFLSRWRELLGPCFMSEGLLGPRSEHDPVPPSRSSKLSGTGAARRIITAIPCSICNNWAVYLIQQQHVDGTRGSVQSFIDEMQLKLGLEHGEKSMKWVFLPGRHQPVHTVGMLTGTAVQDLMWPSIKQKGGGPGRIELNCY